MSTEYTKVLSVILVLLVLSAGLWIIQNYAMVEAASQENFISDQVYASQNQFVTENIAKAKLGDSAIDVSYPPYPDDLKKATEDIDLFAKRERPPTEKWYTNVMSSEILKKEQQCQKIEKPEDLPEDAVKQRMDCAWMFNPTGRSGATLCSIAGPVLSTSRQKFPNTTFKFLWSKADAIKKERIKLCGLTKNCNLLTPGSGCGFCPELGYAVPANSNGSSIYEEAKCPYNAVTDPNQCYKPRAQGGGAVPGVQNTDICLPDSGGRLSKACLGALAQQASCTDSGTILRALNDSTNPILSSKQVNNVVDVMRSYNFTVNDGLLTDGKITTDVALDNYIKISKAAQNATQGRVRKAAGNLCSGSPFQVCDYDDNSQENFSLACLQEIYQQVGCQGRGADFPNETNLQKYYGTTWGNIKKSVNLLADKMTNSYGKYTVEEQKEAVLRCIGTKLRKKKIGYCNELGISVKIMLTTNKDHYYGRKILTNQFFMLRNDSTLWDSLDVFQSPWHDTDVTLIVETNFNPENTATLSYTRVGNSPDVILWNDSPMVNKSMNGLAQDPVNGLSVIKDKQQDQRLKMIVQVPSNQQSDRTTIWYMADSNGTQIPITVCRLPIERKNPVMNIMMNGGMVSEITKTFDIQAVNTSEGNKGGRSCTVFNGDNSYVKINTKLRNKAFRSYTLKFYSESLGNCTRLFQFYNGAWTYSWQWVWWGWGWQQQWRYDAENYGLATDALDIELGYQSPGIYGQYKTPGYPGWNLVAAMDNSLKMNNWQHLTFIWNDDYSGYSLYLEGIKISSCSKTIIQEQFTWENYIGKGYWDGWTSMFKGGMEWFRAFDYPLGPDEIQQDMDDDW
jgi:hypothetical protein